MECADSFKSENLERDCGGCVKSPFYEKYIQCSPTPSPYEIVIEFLQNYTNRDYNRSEPVVQMICEVKKVYKCQHRFASYSLLNTKILKNGANEFTHESF